MKQLLLVLTLITALSLYRLGTDMFNEDAHLWLERSVAFTNALLKGDLKGTYQDPKPGVPVMLLSGASVETFLRLYEYKFGFRPLFYTYDTFCYINFAAKIPLVTLNIAFIVSMYLLVKKLFTEKIALLATVILGFQPFYLANSRFLHVDSTLTIFMNLSFLLYLYGIQSKQRTITFLSAITAGLALLTKTQALFLFPLMALITLLHFVLVHKNVKDNIHFFVIWVGSTFVAYFILFPAFWVNGIETFTNIMKEAFFVASTGNTSVQPFFHYFSLLTKDISFVGLMLLLTSIFFLIAKAYKEQEKRFIYISIVSFIFFYFIQMSIVKQKVDRYMLPLYPISAISISIFLLSNKFVQNEKLKNKIMAVVLALSFTVAAAYSPHYYAYAVKSYEDNYSAALFSEAARYINNKDDPYEAKVVSMTKTESLRPFIKGKTFGHEEAFPKDWRVNYVVTNDYWLTKYGKPKYFNKCNKVHVVAYRKTAFWDVYECN
jgi:hypothetical protein